MKKIATPLIAENPASMAAELQHDEQQPEPEAPLQQPLSLQKPTSSAVFFSPMSVPSPMLNASAEVPHESASVEKEEEKEMMKASEPLVVAAPMIAP